MWKNIEIDNDIYMIYVAQKDDTIKVSLTNLIEIWMERLTNETILDRCRNLNPLLDVEAFNYNEIILDILNDISKHKVEASVEQIELRAEIDGGLMKFTVNLTKGTPQDFWENITKPLCISSMEIIRQREYLLDLVRKKDEEIAEYKAEGAELIRKNIETKVFMEEQLKIDVPIPNIIDCTNTFQRMLDFCDKFNLCKCDASATNPTSFSSVCERACENSANGNISMQSKMESVKLRNDEHLKEVTVKDATNKKSRTASMPYRPVKKLKKGLTDSIL